MARTTARAVEKLIDVEEDDDLEPFITTANEIVTEVCEPAGYSDSRLELIERWLSAHFYAILRPERASEGISGAVNESAMHKVDLAFNQTRYGQQAMLLDTEGGLAELNKQTVDGETKRRVSFSWMGKSAPHDPVSDV